MGFEPMTSSLPRKCSTPELRRLIFDFGFGIFDFRFVILHHPAPFHHLSPKSKFRNPTFPFLSGRRGSNSRPIAWKAIALPTELLPHFFNE
jgi:hypothetical protein